MHKYKFLEKRDDDGVLLKFKGYEHAQDATEKFIILLSKSNIYKLLCEKFSKKYVEAYFSKMIFNDLVSISHQIVLEKWEKKQNQVKKIDIQTNYFFLSKYLNNNFDENFNFLIKKNNFILENLKITINLFKLVYYKYLKLKNSILNKNNFTHLNNKNSIAICYGAGVSPDKRSDLFWFNKPNSSIKSVLLYAENSYTVRKYGEEKLLSSLERKNKIKFIKVWEFSFKKKKYFKDLIKELDRVCENNSLDKALLKKSIKLVKKIEFWQSFFEEYSIKIHIDIHESGNDTIAKQIAINLVKGCSFGRTSSYISNKKGIHYNYYPNDIFFCWGKKGVNNMINKFNKKTHVTINNLLIAGYPYDYITEKSKDSVQIIKKKFQNKNTKFNILLLDSSTSENQNYFYQIFTYKKLEIYYKFFLNWVIEDKDIGLIIKPKRIKFLKKLKNINSLLKEAIKTGRCHIVNDELGVIPWHYSEISNLAVGVHSDAIPSGILDCVLNNKNIRAVFFDYPNIKQSEPDLYSWGENRVVFDNLEKMMNQIKKFKLNPQSNKDFGLWPKNYLEHFDSYRDGKSRQRIEDYISDLSEAFNGGLDNKEAINIANLNFAKKWGNFNLVTRHDK